MYAVYLICSKNETLGLCRHSADSLSSGICYLFISITECNFVVVIDHVTCCYLLLIVLRIYLGYLRLGCMARDKGQIYEASDWFKEALQINQVLLYQPLSLYICSVTSV